MRLRANTRLFLAFLFVLVFEPPGLLPPHLPPTRTRQENYGVKSSESEARVKAVYRELDLAREFEQYEADSYARLNQLIDEIPAEGSEDGLKREVFRSFLAKVYKRVSVFGPPLSLSLRTGERCWGAAC